MFHPQQLENMKVSSLFYGHMREYKLSFSEVSIIYKICKTLFFLVFASDCKKDDVDHYVVLAVT